MGEEDEVIHLAVGVEDVVDHQQNSDGLRPLYSAARVLRLGKKPYRPQEALQRSIPRKTQLLHQT